MSDDPYARYAAFIDDEVGPDYPTAVVELVDALRGYVLWVKGAEEDEAQSVCDYQPTEEEERKWQAHKAAVNGLLKEFEAREVDPWLKGIIKLNLNLSSKDRKA